MNSLNLNSLYLHIVSHFFVQMVAGYWSNRAQVGLRSGSTRTPVHDGFFLRYEIISNLSSFFLGASYRDTKTLLILVLSMVEGMYLIIHILALFVQNYTHPPSWDSWIYFEGVFIILWETLLTYPILKFCKNGSIRFIYIHTLFV